MPPGDLRRWVLARRAAAAEEARLAVLERPSTAEAFERGLDLIALATDLHGWPLPEDPPSARQDDLAYARWARLRGRAARS